MLSRNPITEARQFAWLRQQGKSVCEIAQCKSVSRHQVARRLKLLGLEAEIQGLMALGLLSADSQVVRALSAISDTRNRLELARRFARERTSIKGIQIACCYACQSKHAQGQSTPGAEMNQTQVATRVTPTHYTRNQVQLTTMRRVLKDTCDQCVVCRQASPRLREPAWQMSMKPSVAKPAVLQSSELEVCRGCACVEFMARLRREVAV